MLLARFQFADPKLIYDFLKSDKRSQGTLVSHYQEELIAQEYITAQEATDIHQRLAKCNNDIREYAIVFETHTELARAFHYERCPAFEESVMPLLQKLPRQNAKQEHEAECPDDKWCDDQEYTFFRWASGSGFAPILRDAMATRFYQDPEHLNAALQYNEHYALRTALIQGKVGVIEILMQTDFYRVPENINQARSAYATNTMVSNSVMEFPAILKILLRAELYQKPEYLNPILREGGHGLLRRVCYLGDTETLAILLATAFYQDQKNIAEAFQSSNPSILWRACFHGKVDIVEMLLATEYYQSENNLAKALEAEEHDLLYWAFQNAFLSNEWTVVDRLLSSGYYQNPANLNAAIVLKNHSEKSNGYPNHYFLSYACIKGRGDIVRVLLKTEYYQSPDNLNDALRNSNHQMLGLACAGGHLEVVRELLNTDFYRKENNFADFIKCRGIYSVANILRDISGDDLYDLTPAEVLQRIQHQSWFTQTASANEPCEADINSDTKEDASPTRATGPRHSLSLLFRSVPPVKREAEPAVGQSRADENLESTLDENAESCESPRLDAAG